MQESEDRLLGILEGCRDQRRESQKLLYKDFYAYGMSICMRYADNRDEAAEILNDGFMKIFSNIRQFDLSKPFKPWLRTIMVNTSINHYKKKLRTIQAVEINDASNESEAESAISKISYQEIIDMLQTLPPAYRTVFNLYVIEGYTHQEIAKLLDISPGTSKSNLFKAREHLKQIVTDFFQNDYAGRK